MDCGFVGVLSGCYVHYALEDEEGALANGCGLYNRLLNSNTKEEIPHDKLYCINHFLENGRPTLPAPTASSLSHAGFVEILSLKMALVLLVQFPRAVSRHRGFD